MKKLLMNSKKNTNKTFTINSDFNEYKKIFLEENSKKNLVSTNDEKFLYEKHIYDSLGIKLFLEKYGIKKADLLDIGCGGGFPCLPIAIEFPNINVTGVDSISKKIQSVETIKDALKIKNLSLICARAETLKDKKYDIITSRAVAELGKICEYALPLLKKNGYFVAYKSKKGSEEIQKAEPILRKYKAKVSDIIEYSLPLEEVYERCLIIITLDS